MRIKLTSKNSPMKIELKTNVNYLFCNCERSTNQPLCDLKSHKLTDIKPIGFKVEKDSFYYLCGCKKSKSKPFCDGSHKNL
jgi:CDGSH-type Zn-finger protein